MNETQATERLSTSWDGNYISVLQGLNYLFQSSSTGAAIYIFTSLIVLWLSYLLLKPFLWKPSSKTDLIKNFCYLSLVYSVLMPRFKTYNAILIIPALLQCWILIRTNKTAKYVFVGTLIVISFSGVAYQRSDWIARLYNFRFSAALLIFWALFAHHLLGKTLTPWQNKLRSLKNIAKLGAAS